jgi:hypothetical protein
MKTFVYFFKNNPDDILGKIKVKNLEEAIWVASNIKNIPPSEFLEIFEIYERK